MLLLLLFCLGLPCTFTTRLYNGSLPGPTLYMRPGNEYRVTLINELGPEADIAVNFTNGFKEPNTTNIRTHGLHVSGNNNSDNIFVSIGPLETFTYVYNIPCDHGGGLFWYHPHHHGSISVQMSGGAAGQLIIEESQNELDTLPEWYKNISETNSVLLFIQAFVLYLTDDMFFFQVGQELDYLFFWDTRTCDTPVFYTVNGLYQSVFEMETGIWYKFRLTLVEFLYPVSLYIVTSDSYFSGGSGDFGDCTLKLLARDGIPIHGPNNSLPRDVDYMFLQAGQRADVAIMCQIEEELVLINDFGDLLLHILVSNDEPDEIVELTPFEYIFRPNYIVDTFSDNNTNITFDYFDIDLSEDALNGYRFLENNGTYLHTIDAYSYQEWNITNVISSNYPFIHPFHMHLFPFQVISGGNDDTWSDVPPNWAVEGDFVDILHGEGIIRFKADQLGGHFIVHCHLTFHSDQGSIASLFVNGGCNEKWQDLDPTGTYPQCSYHESVLCATDNTIVDNTTSSPTIRSYKPTRQPTQLPTKMPTQMPTLSPTSSPTPNPSDNPSPSSTTEYPIKHSTGDPVATYSSSAAGVSSTQYNENSDINKTKFMSNASIIFEQVMPLSVNKDNKTFNPGARNVLKGMARIEIQSQELVYLFLDLISTQRSHTNIS